MREFAFRSAGALLVIVAACSSSSSGPSSGPGADAGSGGSGSTTGSTSGSGSASDDADTSSGSGTGSPGSTGSTGSGGTVDPGPLVTYGKSYTDGVFNLGPVDWAETQWHNACAPDSKYASVIRQDEGELLAGLWNGIPNVSSYCDACISVTTAKGKTALLRVVTYGDTSNDSIDVSPAAYALLDAGEYPRKMTWQFAECADTGKMVYEFKSGSNQWWTSFWVRNARVPVTKVEVKGMNHDFAVVDRASDGSLTDGGGFGAGPFSIRVTGMDGTQVTDSFAWPAAGIASAMLTGKGNF